MSLSSRSTPTTLGDGLAMLQAAEG
jgi:hypothetical protein